MNDSNIVVESNVVFCKTGIPEHDISFLHQIQDAEKLKKISERRQLDRGIPRFSEKQEQILKNEMRCEYALNDPCWGYSLDKKKIICACINKKCRMILKCNPSYTDLEAQHWKISKADKQLYGEPGKLSRYYLVDMIPDDEMQRYYSDPKNEGLEFPVIRNVIMQEDTEEKQYRIDPLTGKKQIIIGYRWKLDNIGSYEGEDLIPLWGYVDEVFAEKRVARKKAKRIDKLSNESQKTKINITDVRIAEDNEVKLSLKQQIVDNLKGMMKLTELTEDELHYKKCIIIVSNIAERAYVSSILLLSGIEHGFSDDDNISVRIISDCTNGFDDETVLLSSTIISDDFASVSIEVLNNIINTKALVRLEVPTRDYFEFGNKNVNRWCCRGLYGVTHIVIFDNDILDFKRGDGEYDVIIYASENQYSITGQGGKILGRMKESFADVIDELILTHNIEAIPEYIKGIRLVKKNEEISILGMGNLKFMEY